MIYKIGAIILSTLHLAIGVAVMTQTIREATAASSLDVVLEATQNSNYKDNNSMARSIYLPFIVGSIAMAFAFFKYFYILGVIGFMLIIETIFFLWSFLGIYVIKYGNKHLLESKNAKIVDLYEQLLVILGENRLILIVGFVTIATSFALFGWLFKIYMPDWKNTDSEEASVKSEVSNLESQKSGPGTGTETDLEK
ncbi:unnamed protein product [Caenorhabditis angaria]|uniref:Uncharacterized protein n=1 Tax=Caenorhabditis angaria TaxID=860376 RepID=A0A9P1IQ54_9PELO|nr:unnamed protein product [Caenorhabditis angaria]